MVDATVDITQKQATLISYVRFKHTPCLFLCPNNTIRSLSTPIVVVVSKETEHNIKLAMKLESKVKRQISQRSFSTEIQ